jgi:putative FmdB family regulatory protein
MPVYEYLCKNCKSKFELMRSMGQYEDDANCPRCDGPAKKLLSVFTAFSSGIGTVATRQASGNPLAGNDPVVRECPTCSDGTCDVEH